MSHERFSHTTPYRASPFCPECALALGVTEVQEYVRKRLHEQYRGKSIHPDTVKKELTTLDRQASCANGRRFPDDFKRDAVRLVVEEEYTFKAAAKAVGVSEKSLRDWHKRFAPPPRPCGEEATVDELREENKRLRKQLKRAGSTWPW